MEDTARKTSRISTKNKNVTSIKTTEFEDDEYEYLSFTEVKNTIDLLALYL